MANASYKEQFYEFIKFLYIDRREVIDILFYAIFSALVGLSLPLGIQAIVGFFMSGAFSASLLVLIFLIVAGTLIYGILQVRQMQILQKIKQKVFYKFSMLYVENMPKVDLETNDNYYLPELSNRFLDTIAIQKGYQKLLLDIPLGLIQILFGLLLLSFYHPFFIGFGFILLLVSYLIFKYTAVKGLETGIAASDYKYRVFAWIQQIASSIVSFKFYPKNYYLTRQDNYVSKHIEYKTQHFEVQLFQFYVLIGFKVIITSIMLLLGSFLLINQEINVGQFIAADIVIIAIMSSVEKLILNLESVYDSIIGFQKVSKLLKLQQEHSGKLELSKMTPVEIEIQNMGYKFKDELVSLVNELKLKQGDVALIYGTSGSGKSILFKILTGMYQQYEGNYLVNQLDFALYDIEKLRGHMSIYEEKMQLFEGSILENITFGREVHDRRLAEILNLLKLQDFVHSQPNGLYQEIGYITSTIPLGIQRKLLLARTLYQEAQFYILESAWAFIHTLMLGQVLDFMKKQNAIIIIISPSEMSHIEIEHRIKLESKSI